VRSIAPESLIVSPASREAIERSVERTIWGWAWADGGVESVHVRIGDGADWLPAELEPARGREWQRFSMPWTPRQPGSVALASQAQAKDGTRQPMSGQRNAIYSVPVTVI
jgi:molybdenum-dependent oxidoreductase-like protein